MTERVPADAYPNIPLSPEMPLRYIGNPDEDGDYRAIFTLDTDELRDRYVVRPLQFEDGDGSHQLAPEQAWGVMTHEFERAREHGIAVPRVTAVLPDGWNGHWLTELSDDGSRVPMQDVLLATERVVPVEITEANIDRARMQAARTVAGMVAYLKSSFAPGRQDGMYYLTEPFRSHNYIYGTTPGETEPDFYMVDTECLVDTPAKEMSMEISQYGDIMLTARKLGALTQNPDLREQAKKLLDYPDPRGTTLGYMEYNTSLDSPDFAGSIERNAHAHSDTMV